MENSERAIAYKYDRVSVALWGWLLIFISLAGAIFTILVLADIINFPGAEKLGLAFIGGIVFLLAGFIGIVLIRIDKKNNAKPDILIVFREDTFIVQTSLGERNIEPSEVKDVEILADNGVLFSGYDARTGEPAVDHGYIRFCLKDGETVEVGSVRDLVEVRERIFEVLETERG